MCTATVVIGSGLLHDRFGYDDKETGNIIVLPFTISIVFQPLIGFLIDRYGNRFTIMYI